MTDYNFGPAHPLAPARLELTARLAESLGLFSLRNVTVAKCGPASDEALATVHSTEYIEAVRRVSADPWSSDIERGLGTEDDPAFAGMHEAAARIAGGSLTAADAVLSGSAVRAVNFSGGLHHAARDHASGFCIYNDAALAIQRLLDGGAGRVAYIDVDAHHGDGTQNIFWDEPRVLTISIHETGMMLFPGTGFAHESGGEAAPGTAANIALPPWTEDGAWLRAFHAVVPPLVTAFAPDVVVSQHGCDSHRNDPLAHLKLSVDGQREAAAAVERLTAQICDNRWIATGGGGYDITNVVPRAWSHLVGIVAGHAIPVTTRIPEEWRNYVREKFGVTAPGLMGDEAPIEWRPWDAGYDPNDDVDRAIMATRREVFPHHGLEP